MKYVKRSLPPELSLQNHNPQLSAQWHPTRNGSLTPLMVRVSSGKKVWWLGECGHEWETTIDKRTRRGTGCPYCSGQKILEGFNDLATTNPQLAKLLHPTLNDEKINPNTISKFSNKPVWWECPLGHKWNRSPAKQNHQGIKCPYCQGRKMLTGFNDLTITHPELAVQWHPLKNLPNLPNETTKGSTFKAWWVCEKGHEWEAHVYSRTANHDCPVCFTFSSKTEQELQNYLKTLNLNMVTNIKGLLPNKKQELDIYLPNQNVAIEFNGVYWHSEAAGKDKNYHYDKWKACKKQGIHLIQVWEDDWVRNPDLIKRMLTHKLGATSEPKVYARNTKTKTLSNHAVNYFLEENHVQGCVNGGVRVGLVCVVGGIEKLVAVMVLKQEPGSQGKTLNLLRFATSQPVVGGFTKLLTHVEKTFSPTQIVTFSDNTISNGGLYENTGFKKERELQPDYMYVVDRVRKHKFGYRLKRFKTDYMLKYETGLTEKQLAILNGITRVWDAGKIKWVKNYDVQ